MIAFADEVLEFDLLPWQKWLLIHALEILPDGSFRFRTVVVLVARQNGKSTLSIILSLFFMYALGVQLVIGTAQDLDVAEEIWGEAVDLAQDNEELSAEIARVIKVNGKKALELKTGERYKVKAANRRAGRGLSGDLVLLDELREHQSWDAWGAITKTTMARAAAMVWAFSNAGDATSIVLRYLRKMAHLALGDPDGLSKDEDPSASLPVDDVDEEFEIDDEDSLFIAEWSAAPGREIWDRDGWCEADPALGYTISERTIASAAKTDPEWVFRTEVLCQWSEGSLVGPFPPGAWEAGADKDSTIDAGSNRAWCVDVSHDRSMSYIGVAGYRKDGSSHVEIVAQRAGTSWVVGWFEEKESRRAWPVTLQFRGAPVSSLVEGLQAVEGLTVVEWSGSNLGSATGAFYDSVRCEPTKNETGITVVPPRIFHRPQPVLDLAAATAAVKLLGESYVWSRAKSPVDAAPLIAVTGALWALNKPIEVSFVSAYSSDRGVEVI